MEGNSSEHPKREYQVVSSEHSVGSSPFSNLQHQLPRQRGWCIGWSPWCFLGGGGEGVAVDFVWNGASFFQCFGLCSLGLTWQRKLQLAPSIVVRASVLLGQDTGRRRCLESYSFS